MILVMALGGVARADTLWEAEVRAGYGVEMSPTQGSMSARPSPLTLEATGALAVVEDPKVFGYAGMIAETVDKSGIGTVFGAQLDAEPIRISGGGVWIFAPYTLWGATASVGTCKRFAKTTQVCGDAVLTSYFAGTDLVKGHTVTEAQLAIGLVFDAP
jgi:hypothetical protein